jgi:hypothetical protein
VLWCLWLVDFFHGATAPLPSVGQDLLIIESSRSHLDTTQSVGLLWTSDKPDAETSTWRYSTHIYVPSSIRTRNPTKLAATRIGTCWITGMIFIWTEVRVSVLQLFYWWEVRAAVPLIGSDVCLLSEAVTVRSGSHCLCSCFLTSPRDTDITRTTNLTLSPTLSSPASSSLS